MKMIKISNSLIIPKNWENAIKRMELESLGFWRKLLDLRLNWSGKEEYSIAKEKASTVDAAKRILIDIYFEKVEFNL